MCGSMLIIALAMWVVPTLGWRWMIRISVAPSVALLYLFKVAAGHRRDEPARAERSPS